MQSLLLRFLENGEIQPLGSTRRSAIVDVRVITATNRRLHERVAAGEFREDLFYRLNISAALRDTAAPRAQRRCCDAAGAFSGALQRDASTPAPHAERCGGRTTAGCALARQRAAASPRRGAPRPARSGGPVRPEDLPRDLLPPPPVLGPPPTFRTGAEVAFERMVRDGESFWTVVPYCRLSPAT